MSMRCFEHIAKLIRTKRINHTKGYSQSELSHLLGYKNGQFISNVERALCNVPLKMLTKVSEVLDINPDDLKNAILKDHEKTLDNYLQAGMTMLERPQQLNSVESVHLPQGMDSSTSGDVKVAPITNTESARKFGS